jgi:hypothetical protein
MWWVRKQRRKVSVHLDDNTTLEGFWCGTEDGHYVLEPAQLVESAERSHDLQGIVMIPRANVRFVQVLSA